MFNKTKGIYARCPKHGGIGAKTPEAIERIRQARLSHGETTAPKLQAAKLLAQQRREAKALKAQTTTACGQAEKPE